MPFASPQPRNRLCRARGRSAPFYMSQTPRHAAISGPAASQAYNPECRRCPRLALFRDRIHEAHSGYFCRPVPSFGDAAARLIIVGLAPGLHGANASGRPFTGDYAGMLLYATLHKFGFATGPQSLAADDSLRLIDARITNAVKCV